MADSKIVKKRLNNSYRCGYCLHYFNKLEDPRTLPCLHVYCMKCLKTDIGYKKTHIECAYCRKKYYEITDPTTLPVARFGDPLKYEALPKPVAIPCDVCEDGTGAVVFCVESEKKLCEQHQQNHDTHMKIYSNTTHHFIPIDLYTSSPQRYSSMKCEHHEHHQLMEACTKCHHRFCIRCDSKSKCGRVAGKAASHDLTLMSNLSRELRDKLTEEMKILSEKISELNDISKDAWRQLSEIEDDVKKMFARVYATANAKIEEIRKSAEELKDELSEYLRSSTEMVVNFRYDLAVKHGVDKLSLVDRVQHAVDKFNDAEIVRDYKEMSEKMEKALNIRMIEKCSVPRKFWAPANSEDSLGLKLVNVGTAPASLQFDGLVVHGSHYIVNVTADEALMCRTVEGIEVRNRHTLNTINSVRNTNTTEWEKIIYSQGVVVGSCYNKKEKTAEITLLDPNSLNKSRSLYKQSVGTPTIYSLTQQLSLVYLIDWRKKQLIVCSLVDDKIQSFPIPKMKNPHSVCILPDSTLLIKDFTADGGVSRYKLENATLTLMWEFPHISQPTGISFDPTSELIHICTLRGPLLILSLEGKLLKTITRESFMVRSYVYDIAVYNGGNMFLACRDGLRKYTLKY